MAALLLVITLAAQAGAPALIEELERAVDDDPLQSLQAAEAALRTARPGSEAHWKARVQEVLAASTLEMDPRVSRLLPGVREASRGRETTGVVCLLDTLDIGSTRIVVSEQASEELALAALEKAKGADQAWCLGRLQLARGRVHSNDGRVAQGLRWIQAALSAFETSGEVNMQAWANSSLGWVYRRDRESPGALDQAIAAGQLAVAQVDPVRRRYQAATAHHNLGGSYLAAGRLDEARAEATTALHLADAIRDELGAAYIARLLARIDLTQGNPRSALQNFTRARDLFLKHQVDDMALATSIGRAKALLELKNAAEARQQLAEAEPLRAKVGLPEFDVDYHEQALAAHAAAGDAAAATRAVAAYVEAFRQRTQAENRVAATEVRERFQRERAEAENRLLKEQQAAVKGRQFWLLVALALAVLLVSALVLYTLQQQRLRQRLRVLAEVDELTGLPNRRAILQSAHQLNSQATRSHPAGCLAMLDIDHFKGINDRYGHETGDRALVAFAQACRQALRSQDTVGRVGGEEFLAVLPATRPEDAHVLFERLQRLLRETTIEGLATGERLTCSMGCAGLNAGGEVMETLKQADEALYRAKHAGRDRMALAG